ncbi:MAG: hypothetical protein CME61_07525 [Halobacteriovoraceae bacterium]|nr:hypothetical protein [Halobacteriovoraceae bacterium]
MTHGENGNRTQGQRKRRPYNKRRNSGNRGPNGNRSHREKNGNRAVNDVEKNGNVMSASGNPKSRSRDDQSQLLPQTVTVTANDYTQAAQEAMLKLNIHDESLLSHEILDKGKRNFLGILGSRDITYKFSIVPKIDVMAQTFIENVLRLALLDVTFELIQNEGNLDISIEGDDGEVLKANGFELVNSIEQLLRKHLIKKAALRNSFKINFTVNGEVNSKEAKLENLASKMRDKLLKTKKPVTLNSMSPRDRRVIHQFFSEDEEVNTRSFGDGYYKKIKLFLNKNNKDAENSPTEESNIETQMTEQSNDAQAGNEAPESNEVLSNGNTVVTSSETVDEDNIGNS